MVVSPVVRGLFGLSWDTSANTLNITPPLPADWPGATVRNVPFGNAHLDLKFTRSGADLVVETIGAPVSLRLGSQAAGARVEANTLHIPLPAVEIAIAHRLPEFGAETAQMKVLDQQASAHRLTLTLSGMGGTTSQLQLRENVPNLQVHADGATLEDLRSGLHPVAVAFPNLPGYQAKTIKFTW